MYKEERSRVSAVYVTKQRTRCVGQAGKGLGVWGGGVGRGGRQEGGGVNNTGQDLSRLSFSTQLIKLTALTDSRVT